jgi:hypothetical protein
LKNTAFSAFGATHPVHDPAGQRVRWFCPWPMTNRESANRLLHELERYDTEPGVTRLTVRVLSFGEPDSACIEALNTGGFLAEASMKLAGDRNPVISYLGKCKPGRQASPEDRKQERTLVQNILSTPVKGPARIIRRFNQAGEFEVVQLLSGSLRKGDRSRLIAMHQAAFPTFPYDFGSKIELMLEAPETFLMVAIRSTVDQKIYAFSNLEINDLVMEGGQRFRLAEYDNSMRMESGAGDANGLGSMLRLELARLAYRRNVDLCHSESRAGLFAINNISCQIGMNFGGALEKHLLISGKNDISYQAPSDFETMNVWFMNRQDLSALERLSLSANE